MIVPKVEAEAEDGGAVEEEAKVEENVTNAVRLGISLVHALKLPVVGTMPLVVVTVVRRRLGRCFSALHTILECIMMLFSAQL